MRLVPALAALVLLTACAPAATVAVGPDHPASPAAPAGRASVPMAALTPAPAARLPDALRPASADAPAMDPVVTRADAMTGDAAGDAPAVDHAAMGHTMPATSERPAAPAADASTPGAPAPMAEALDAYLAIHDALAQDDAAGAAAHGAHFASAFGALAEAPPAGDPHFWHSRSADVAAVRTAADALAGAQALGTARVAFGELSVPFARLVEAAGAPEGYALARFTCGMFRDAPEGGVWLQRDGDTRNPYFGTAMLTCGTRNGAVAAAAAGTEPAGL